MRTQVVLFKHGAASSGLSAPLDGQTWWEYLMHWPATTHTPSNVRRQWTSRLHADGHDGVEGLLIDATINVLTEQARMVTVVGAVNSTHGRKQKKNCRR